MSIVLLLVFNIDYNALFSIVYVAFYIPVISVSTEVHSRVNPDDGANCAVARVGFKCATWKNQHETMFLLSLEPPWRGSIGPLSAQYEKTSSQSAKFKTILSMVLFNQQVSCSSLFRVEFRLM